MMDEGLLENLISLEESRLDAWLSHDESRLRGLLSDEFVEINIFGRLHAERILADL